MKTHFKSVEEFFGVKERCVFCQSKLKIVFINFSRSVDNIPIIKAKVRENKFSFNLKHVSDSFELDVKTEIDIKTNVLKFSCTEENDPWKLDLEKDKDRQRLAQQVFENLGPHVELYCPNRKCKMKYHICSDIFKLMRDEDQLKIKSIRLYMESFVLPKLWIQNDWIFSSTNIYSTVNLDADPLRTPLLDLESLGKIKIINRINTLVTFS